jgi:hypothetical protein
MPTLSSALNVAVNLYGQRVLEAMLLEPEAAQRPFRRLRTTGKAWLSTRCARAEVPDAR